MTYASRLAAVLSSCLLAACCLAAVGPASAHAEATWLIKGSKVASGLNPSLNWKPDVSTFAFLLPTLGFELVFKKFELLGASLSTEGKATAKFKLSEGEVNTISPLKPVPCKVGDLVFETSSKLFLHGGKTYIALTMETLTTYSGPECPLGKENLVKGTVALEAPELEKEATEHLVTVAPAALFPELKLSFGASSMVFDGGWVLSLAGAHSGLAWSGVG
jgi:hypothetical protein